MGRKKWVATVFSVRLDAEENELLGQYCQEHNIEANSAFRYLVRRLPTTPLLVKTPNNPTSRSLKMREF